MDLGIDLTAATLEEFRLAQGIQTAYSEMTQAEKVMLRYQYLMSVTTTQQGDFQRTSKSLANSLRTLKAYIQAVETQLGAGLGAAIRHVVVWLNEMMKYVLKAASAFRVLMETLFGKYKGGASGVAMEGLGDAVDDVDNLASGAGNAADGLGSAADAAKQLNKDLSVLPFDELNQLNKDRDVTSSGSGTGGVGGGGAGGGLVDGLLNWENMLDDSPLGKLPEWFSRWGQAMKDAVKIGDFNRLGEIIAEGLNKGIDKLYDILNPEKAKEKIFPYIDAFTTTFNSAVDDLKWEKLGATAGEGINIVVASLNRAIEGISWRNLGKKLAAGANGLVDEVNFEEVGNLIGNKIMVVWNVLNGWVHDFKWDKLGVQIGNLINGLFDRVSFTTIADTLATGLNGLFDTLKNASETIGWEEIATNISNGIITFIDEFEWEENAETIRNFLTNLCDAIVRAVDNVPDEKWEELGQGIADMLAAAPWEKILTTVGHVIVKALGGILKGLLKNPEGAFAAAVIAGLSLLKFKDSAFSKFIGNIVTALTGKSSTTLLTGAGNTIGNTILNGVKTVLPSAGIATLIGGGTLLGIAGVAEAEKSLERRKGGNGQLTEMGTQLSDLMMYLGQTNQLTEEQSNALFMLKENMETTGATNDEMAAAFVQKYQEMGGSTQSLNGYIESLMFTAQAETGTFNALQTAVGNAGTQHGILGQAIDIANSKVQGLSNTATVSYGNVGNSVTTATNIVKSKLQEQISKIKDTATEFLNSGTTTKTWNSVVANAMTGAGTSVNSFNKGAKANLLDTRLAFKDTESQTTTFKNSTNTNMTSSGNIVTDFMGKVKNMATNSISQYISLNKSATSHLQGIDKQTQNTIKETDKMSPAMEKSAKGASSVFNTNILTIIGHVVAMGIKLSAAFLVIQGGMLTQGKAAGESYAKGMTEGLKDVYDAIDDLKTNLTGNMAFDLYNAGQQAGQSFANGIASVNISVPHLYVSSWNLLDYGNGYTYYPNFSVAWYRKGGLFLGGNGSLIGVGEDNRDEAVLPLEDRRAMARIGSAIADAGGPSGISDEAVDKLAGAIAGIVMDSQSSYNNDQMNYIELKVDDEVLARAVTRGQQKLDYRNNPTPQMA